MGLFQETTDEEFYIQQVAQPLSAKVEQSLEWIKKYEPLALQISELGYYVAFSGGKDSVVLKRLFEMSGVAHHCWYNNVTIDPPELVWFIKKHHPDVGWNNPEMHLISKMVDKSCGPPTRISRWCCEIYKEQGGNGLFKATGVRAEESPRRKKTWSLLTSHRVSGDPIICPILYWTDHDIWTFIKQQQIPYCSLYDEGFKRLGCIGCPMGGPKAVRREFDRWPRYEALWKRGFQQYWDKWKGVPRRDGKDRWIEKMNSVDDLWNWWISGKAYEGNNDCQMYLW